MNELIVIEKYEGREIEFRRTDGYLNLTALCRAFGKRSNDFMRLPSTKRTLVAQAKRLVRLPEDLVVVVTDSANGTRGTWLHPAIAIAAARWVSEDFECWCDDTMKSIVDGKKVLVDVAPVSASLALDLADGMPVNLSEMEMAEMLVVVTTTNLKNKKELVRAKHEIFMLTDRTEKQANTIEATALVLKDKQEEIKEMKPKAAFHDAVVERDEEVDMAAAAKELKFGDRHLLHLLIETKDFIYKRKGEPSYRPNSENTKNGRFRIVPRPFRNEKANTEGTGLQVMASAEGQVWLQEWRDRLSPEQMAFGRGGIRGRERYLKNSRAARSQN